MTSNPLLISIVQKININHLSTAINETSSEGHDDADNFAAAAVTNVMDDIGVAIETLLLPSLR